RWLGAVALVAADPATTVDPAPAGPRIPVAGDPGVAGGFRASPGTRRGDVAQLRDRAAGTAGRDTLAREQAELGAGTHGGRRWTPRSARSRPGVGRLGRGDPGGRAGVGGRGG